MEDRSALVFGSLALTATLGVNVPTDRGIRSPLLYLQSFCGTLPVSSYLGTPRRDMNYSQYYLVSRQGEL